MAHALALTDPLTFMAETPPLRFDWMADALPPGPWTRPLRETVYAHMHMIGWKAVHEGEFAPLERLYDDFVTIYPRLLADRDDIDRAANLYTLLYIMLWRRTQLLSELKPFNRDVVAPFAAFLSRVFSKERPRPIRRAVPRIAYLSETSDVAGSNAIARITVSLMLGQQALRGPDEQPILYCINSPSPALWAFAGEHGLHLRDLARPTPSLTAQAVIDQLAADDVDILITDCNCAVATMVMQRRPARIQAFHENGFAPWAIPELDLAFMGISPPAPGLFNDRVAMHQTPRNTAFIFQKIAPAAGMIETLHEVLRTESGVAEPSVIYGNYGRMAKITADYMAQVEAILLRDPKAIFFAGGTGRISPIVERLRTSPAADRMVIYNDYIDGHLVAECIDVFLDSFPFPGGMSCIEVQARGVPVIWMAPPPADELNIIAGQRDDRLKAATAEDYVELAVRLADPGARGELSATALDISRRFGDMREQAEMVENHLRGAWRAVRDAEQMA